MKWWIVKTYNECDYPSRGNEVTWIVAANTYEDVLALLPKRDSYEDPYSIAELVLPDLKRKKKPFIWA